MKISQFKATCIAALREVNESGEPLVVTLRGKPLATVIAASEKRKLGALRGECVIRGDIVNAEFADDWEMNA